MLVSCHVIKNQDISFTNGTESGWSFIVLAGSAAHKYYRLRTNTKLSLPFSIFRLYLKDIIILLQFRFNCTKKYRTAGNFRWCKFSRKSVQTLQKKFPWIQDSPATPLPVDGHTPYAKRHWTTKRRSKPVQQQPNLPFVWRLSKLRRYQSRRPPWARNRRVGFSTADLDFNNFGVSHGFVGILYSSRLILLYSNHLDRV